VEYVIDNQFCVLCVTKASKATGR